MAKVNILTIVNEPNYGACLQGYALYETLKIMGHEPRIINLLIDFRSKPYNRLNRMLLSLYRKIKGYSGCFEKAKNFTDEFMPSQTPPFYCIDDLKSYKWNADEYYIVGSDQVWNPIITGSLATAYNLSFLPEHCKLRYAYASSFGSIKDESQLLENLPIKGFQQFLKIAVREKFGVDFLAKYGVSAKEVIDPTLLLSSYKHLLKRDIVKQKHLLFLALSDTNQQQLFVKSLSTTLNLPIKKLYGYLQPSRKMNKEFVSVEEWLQNIAEAEVVVTDSFHATVFSILFHRPFFVYLSAEGKGERIFNLLNNVGIAENRIIQSADEANIVSEIDWDAVDKNISCLRQNSQEYLNSIFAE